MRARNVVTMGALAAALAAAPGARAGDVLITPFAGVVFGGDLGDAGGDDRHPTYGLGLGFLGEGLLGFEVELGYTPDFFGGDDAAAPDNNLTSLMGNLVLSGRMGERSRIYVSGGAGLLKARVDDADDFFDVDRNDFGADAGGGLILALGDKLALRGDIRYFRNLGDPEPDGRFDLDFGSFDFWRAAVGLALQL